MTKWSNVIDWSNLQATQRILDERIQRERDLDPGSRRYIQNRILALRVELAEYANETRVFKDWSGKPKAPEERRLDEAVDVIHFYLNAANGAGIRLEEEPMQLLYRISSDVQGLIVEYLNEAYDLVHRNMTRSDIITSLECFLSACLADGLTLQQLERAYYAKNKINHERQNKGY